MKLLFVDCDGVINSQVCREAFLPKSPWINEEWFNWHAAFKNELINKKMIKLINSYAKVGYKVALLTNRSTGLEEETIAWYMEHGLEVVPTTFFRMKGDNRSSSDYKLEILRAARMHTYANHFDIVFIDDDGKNTKAATDLGIHVIHYPRFAG